ncbi:MAG: universal stress protein [Chloroflexi bacterium]|nr:universal stress protein [Chloroflexota bacterium]
MSDSHSSGLARAVQDFREARRKAALQKVMARVTGRSDSLLSFDDIEDKLRLGSPYRRYLDDIPLDSIIGSVGRYLDFNREFLPLSDSDESRWARVRVAFEEQGLAPVEVHKIGETYFVLDGNHRVSIARRMGATHIEAFVNEFATKIAFTPEDELDDVLLKAEMAEFMEATQIRAIRPEVDLSVTEPGMYREIYEHIQVHHYYLGLDWKRDFSLEEAVTSWVDTLYLPVVRLIRELGILRDFPGRTEADLYLWLTRYQAELAESLGWRVEPERAASDLVERMSSTPRRVWARVRARLLDWLTPDPLEGGPPPGTWRTRASQQVSEQRLFTSLLVAVSGEPGGWTALDQAIAVARRENASIRGLHVVRAAEDMQSQRTETIRAEFDRRCSAAGVEAELAVEAGSVTDLLVRRAVWTDLMVVGMSHPPARSPLGRLRSGFRALIQRSPRPVLAVPAAIRELNCTLLAYDGSPKAEEALFLAAYLATCWRTDLLVLPDTSSLSAMRRTEARARAYLEEQGVSARYLSIFGNAAEATLGAARENGVDLIVMGGYGKGPLMSMFFDSTLDKVLRGHRKPVLICR